MSTQQQKKETLVHGYIRTCQKQIHFDIPNDIVEMIGVFYIHIFELLQFVKIGTDVNNNLILEDNRYLARINGYRWQLFVLADIKPIMNGIHCFRVYNKSVNGQCYVMWMVSQCKNKYIRYSYDDKSCYGISYQEWFSRGHPEKKNNGIVLGIGNLGLRKSEIEVDMLLDLEKEELRICVVGNKEQEAKIWPVPKCKAGYKPHLHLVDVDITRLCRIPVNWYGLEKDGIFPKD
eukprot:402043_1